MDRVWIIGNYSAEFY